MRAAQVSHDALMVVLLGECVSPAESASPLSATGHRDAAARRGPLSARAFRGSLSPVFVPGSSRFTWPLGTQDLAGNVHAPTASPLPVAYI
ncbi:hypothetical protein MTO96_014614 [Rhipicephalus appendiculatus]